jgi:hypothetical protein
VIAQKDSKRRERPTRSGASAQAAQAASAAPCCSPVIVGTFRNQMLVSLEHRHLGRFCAGNTDKLDIAAWRAEKGLR